MPDSSDPLRNLPLVITEPHTKRAAGWQIALATFGVLAIVAIFFFGLNHQRDETAGEQTAATTPAAVAPQDGDTQQGQGQQSQQQAGQQPQQQAPSTTGQSSGADKSNNQNDRQPAAAKNAPAQRQPK
jgi:hypothetical protein